MLGGGTHDRDLSRMGRAGRWCCVAGAGIGALGLLAWTSGLGGLTAIIRGQRAMTPNTALSLFLIGVAAALRAAGKPRRVAKTLSIVAALVVLSVSVATLAEYVLGVDLRLDRILFGRDLMPYPWRPSGVTVVALSALSSGLIVFDKRPGAAVRPSECFALLGGLAA